MLKKTLTLSLLLLIFSLASCGGGGSRNNNNGNQQQENISPIAAAGEDQTVDPTAVVTLQGSQSSDSDGSITVYAWSQIAGPNVTLNNSSSESPSFVAPDLNSELTFRLTVTDDAGAVSSDEITITVTAPAQAPIAEAGADRSVTVGTRVTLNGSESSDLDGTIAGFSWSQIAGPTVLLSGENQSLATFTAPEVTGGSNEAEFVFQLEVTDNQFLTDADEVTVTVSNGIFTIAGSISIPQGTAVDSDVNDISTAPVSNNSFQQAQLISNPVTLGGYVNQPFAGAEGLSQVSGDLDDVFYTTLLEGQVITLLVASDDLDTNDIDLILYDEFGNVVDDSSTTGEIEQVVIPSTGEYFIHAAIYTGASNYTLIIGQNQSQQAVSAYGRSISDNFLVDEVVVKYKSSLSISNFSQGISPMATHLGFKTKSGAADREMLLKLDTNASILTAVKDLNPTANTRILGKFKSPQDQQKWELLIALKQLNKDPLVAYAEPNFILKPLIIPNDEHFPLQWHYTMINLPAAWDITTGSPDITVAVIDTGVLLNHPDMQGQLINGFDFISNPANAADGNGIDNNPDDPGDSDGSRPSSFHGTHVAGTIAAATNNNIGVAGIAWDVKVMPLRALGVDGGSSYDINQAIRFAAGLSNDSGQVPPKPADVINMSLGGPGFSQASQSTINAARAAGVTIVAAAGNDSSAELFFPASYDGVISVSALGAQNTLAPYSNFGSAVDVTAPGGDLRRDVNGDGFPDGVLSNSGDDSGGNIEFNFTFQNGTSMASPHVAGVIALMKSVNPGLSPADIDLLLAQNLLTNDLGQLGRDDSFGNGVINAQKAVRAALDALGTPPVNNPQLGVSPESLNLSDNTALEINLRNSGGGDLRISAISVTQSWLNVTASSNVDSQGLGAYIVEANRSGLADGIYSAFIEITSLANGTTSSSLSVPVIMQVGAADQVLDAGYTYILLVDAISGEPIAQNDLAANNSTYNYQFDNIPAGTYQLIAGSDRDNDGFICDSGESCGAYRTIDQPVEISVANGNLFNLDFTVGYSAALPSGNLSLNSEGKQVATKRVPSTRMLPIRKMDSEIK